MESLIFVFSLVGIVAMAVFQFIVWFGGNTAAAFAAAFAAALAIALAAAAAFVAGAFTMVVAFASSTTIVGIGNKKTATILGLVHQGLLLWGLWQFVYLN